MEGAGRSITSRHRVYPDVVAAPGGPITMDESTAAPIPPAPGPIAKAVATVATAEKNQQVPRLWLWMIAAANLAVLVGMIAPQQVGNVLMKTLLVFMAGITSYFLDRALFLFVEVKLDESQTH